MRVPGDSAIPGGADYIEHASYFSIAGQLSRTPTFGGNRNCPIETRKRWLSAVTSIPNAGTLNSRSGTPLSKLVAPVLTDTAKTAVSTGMVLKTISLGL